MQRQRQILKSIRIVQIIDISCDFERTGCAWIEGSAGTGKTAFCRNILTNIVARYGTAFDFYICDTSGGDYGNIAEELHIPGPDAEYGPGLRFLSGPSEALRLLEEEISERWQRLLQAEKTRPWAKRITWADFLWNRVFFVFDRYEPKRWSDEEKDRLLQSLRTLYRFCDRLGVHMIAVTSAPSESRAGDLMRLESKARICMRTPTPFNYVENDYWDINERARAKTLGIGEFIYSMPGQSGKGSFTAAGSGEQIK